MDLKQYALAIADFTAALRLDSGYANAYTNRANARLQLSDSIGAYQDYIKAAQLGSLKVREFLKAKGIDWERTQ